MSCHEVSSPTTLRNKHELIKVAIVGNPNVGKSALFNKLTGGNAWVGNWPGVTVEKKTGRMIIEDLEVELVDLPGIYGLTPYSLDEVIARKFILEEKPRIVVQVVNAVNLERNLYLTIQLLEMNVKLIIALNMIDLAEKEGLEIDINGLMNELNAPIIPTIAVKEVGVDNLTRTIIRELNSPPPSFKIYYGPEIEEAIQRIEKILDQHKFSDIEANSRWIAIHLLEDDKNIEELFRNRGLEDVLKEVAEIKRDLETKLGESIEVLMIEKRYQYILSLTQKYVKRRPVKESLTTFTDRLDRILTHPILGLMVFISALYLLFKFSFDVASPLTDLLDILVSDYVYSFLKTLPVPAIISSLLADGVLQGVGILLIFIPNLFFLFLGISFLEDTGYLARITFLSDKWMNKIGLSGRAIIPLLIGFGCNVPSILSTRVLGDDKDRRLAMYIIPFMSCSARLPIYLLFTLVFFKENQMLVILSIYFIGVTTAIITALLFNKLLFKGQTAGYVMDMPPYLIPSVRNVLAKSWERIKSFLVRAGTIIVIMMIIIWALSIFGPEGYLGIEALRNPDLLSRSWIASFSKLIEPIFKPFNWDWRIVSSLLFGFVAKEVVVSSLSVLYNVEMASLSTVLSSSFTPLTAYSLMVFTLLYTPCMATAATLKTEIGLKNTIFIIIYELFIAYIMAYLVLVLGGLIL